MRGSGEVVGQVAQVEFDLAEGLVFGQIDEAVGQGLEGAFGISAEGLEGLLAARLAVIAGGGGAVQHEGRPGVAPNQVTKVRGFFATRPELNRSASISHLLS